MIFLFKFLSLPNKSIVLDTRIKNEDSIFRKVSISSSKYIYLFLLETIAILSFKGAKTLPSKKKTWLSISPKTLKAKRKKVLF